MVENSKTDAFTHFILNKIDPEVSATFTPTQLAAIREAISAGAPLKKHPLDIRGVIPLFFVRIYFVFLVGRDRRTHIKNVEANRRKSADILAGMVFAVFILSPILIVAFIAMYFMKTALGIDIFPDLHLWEFFK